MPRLNTIDPEHATGKAREIFDGPLRNKHFNLFKGLANSPAALDAYLAFSGALGKGSLTAAEREAVALAIGEANQCEYCVAAHSALAKGAGLSEAHAIGARRGTINDAKKLDALVKFALRIHEKKGHVSDADLTTFKDAGYTDAHAVEVVANYALSIYTNYFNHLNQTAVDFPAVGKV